MKTSINIPGWLVKFYEKKAELRRKLGRPSNLRKELETAIEQYALDSISHPMGSESCQCRLCCELRESVGET